MSANECPIDGCPNGRHAGHLMCGRHWAMVPTELRKRVWATRDLIFESVEDFAAWEEAADVAVSAVEEKLAAGVEEATGGC